MTDILKVLGDYRKWLKEDEARMRGQKRMDAEDIDADETFGAAITEIKQLRIANVDWAIKAGKLRATITAMTEWLEENQGDVFQRGLWDAIPTDTSVSDTAQRDTAADPQGGDEQA